jgi:hypothetical protein
MGPPQGNPGSSFDPFLPCHSHHIQTDRGRGASLGQRIAGQQRSSSVPPAVDPNANGTEARNTPSASSARTTPLQSPARRLTATIDVNLIPVFSRQQQQQQREPIQLLEPSLMNLFSQLSRQGPNSDAGMVNAIQTIVSQLGTVMAGEVTGKIKCYYS